MSGLQLNIFARLKLIKLTVAVGLLISILTSYNLWAGQRWLPPSPFIKDLYLAPPYDYILFITQIILLLILLFTTRVRPVIVMILMLNIFMVLLDQNRLQPWFFIYNSILVVLFFYNWRIDNVNHYYSYFIVLQLLFSAVYVFSGLQKMNSGFMQETFPWFIKPLSSIFSERQMLALNKTAFMVPWLEVIIGVFLLIKPLRFIGIPMLIILHLLIFFLMGPFGKNYNSVIWSWNIVMVVIGLLLFSGKTTERYFSIAHLFAVPVFYVVIVFFWIMPFTNLFNKWETYLSFSLYSGNTHNATIELNEKAMEKLPFYIRHYVKNESGKNILYPKWWCMGELNVPLYPEKRVFERVANHVVNLTTSHPEDVKLVYIEKQKIFAKQP